MKWLANLFIILISSIWLRFEAFILLSWYAAYVIFMKYNETTELFVKKLLAGSKVNNEAEAINADMSCPQVKCFLFLFLSLEVS